MKENCCTKLTKFLLRYVFGTIFAVFVLPILFPFYRLRDGYMFWWWQERRVSSPAEHRKKVAAVQEQVKAWNAAGRPRPMCTARPAAMAFTLLKRDKRQLAKIDLSALDCVVEIDEVNKVLIAEPGLKMGQLTTILESRGWKWTIPVIPETDALTIGGTICGAGLETSSIRYGAMGDTPVGYEVVVSSGEVVNCSREENSDLFYAIPWSHGTLGFVTAVKFPLIRAGKYVQLEYHTTDSQDEAEALLSSQDYTFTEGILYAPQKWVVMQGELVDLPPPGSRLGRVNNINRWYKPLFHNYVKGFLSHRRDRSPATTAQGMHEGEGGRARRPLQVDYIPLRDYYHRYDRGVFWFGPIGCPILETRLYLALLGWLHPILDANLGLQILTPIVNCIGYKRSFLLLLNSAQDYTVPTKHFRATLQFLHDQTGIYPLWICPVKMWNTPGLVHSSEGREEEIFMDIGVYGNVSKEAMPGWDSELTGSKLEEFTISKNGCVGTYADMHLSREQWGQMFDMRLYEKVRVKYGCEDAFPEVYDKVIKNAIRPT